MAEMERSYIVYAIIVVALMVVIALIVLKFYPETFSEVGKIANEVFDIVPEEEAKTIESMDKFISSVESCLSTEFVRCGCKLESRHLPQDYFMLIRNTAEGVSISLLSSEDAVIGSTKLIQGAKIGVLLPAYNKRDAIFSERRLDTIDSVCLFDRDIKLVGNSDDLMSTQIGEDEGIFYADSDSVFRTLPELLKQNENSVCLITTDLSQDDIGDRDIDIEDASDILQKEIVYPVNEITQSGRLRASGLEIEDIDDIGKLTAAYLQSLGSCSEGNQFQWPLDTQSYKVSSCTMETQSGNLASTYEIELPEGSEILAQSNSEVSGHCNDCASGQKWVELKQSRELIGGVSSIFKFKYTGLSSIKEEVTSVQGLRVRKGQPIGQSSGKVKITITDANGRALHPGCIFPSLIPSHYSEPCKCPSRNYPCNMDYSAYFYSCWR